MRNLVGFEFQGFNMAIAIILLAMPSQWLP